MTKKTEMAEYFLNRINDKIIERYPYYCTELINKVRKAYEEAGLNPSEEIFDKISKIEKKLSLI